jgi:hypothetical protein
MADFGYSSDIQVEDEQSPACRDEDADEADFSEICLDRGA